MNLKYKVKRKDEKGRANFKVRQLPLFNQLKPEWSNCESFLGIQGMSGLNIEVSENFPVGDSCMRYRDGSLAFTGLSVGNFVCTVGVLMENASHNMHVICFIIL